MSLTSCDGSFLAHSDGDSRSGNHDPSCWKSNRHLDNKSQLFVKSSMREGVRGKPTFPYKDKRMRVRLHAQ